MKVTAIFVSALLVLLLVTYFFAKEVMIKNPAICSSCHFIKPYYNKWERSTHNRVPCLKCHEYGPLNAFSGQLRVLSGTYNPRPLTNVPDAKCLQAGCHEMRLIQSKARIQKWGIVFDHKPHFTEHRRGINLHCRSCHSDIVQGEHMKVSLNVCFLCHLNIGDSSEHRKRCTVCHQEVKMKVQYRGMDYDHTAPLKRGYLCISCHVSVKVGDGSVPKDRCFFCHADRAGKYKDAVFVHQQHVTKKQIDCFFCHQLVEHGNIRQDKNMDRIFREKVPPAPDADQKKGKEAPSPRDC